MNLSVLIAIPLISCLIGWFTNFLAVKMIFRPYKKRRILGLVVQGLLPKRKAELARHIGNTIEKELISHRDIQEVLSKKSFHNDVVETVLASIQEVIEKQFAQHPMFGAFITPDTVKAIVAMLRDSLEEKVPALLGTLFERMEQEIDFKELVEHKILDFDMHKLEEIVYAIAARELRAIEYFGALLGGVVGLVQVGIILFFGV